MAKEHSNVYFGFTVEEDQFLFTMFQDWAAANRMQVIMARKTTFKAIIASVNGVGTSIHFDQNIGMNFYPGTRIRVWLPLSDIDNYPLIVGDARSYGSEDSGRDELNASYGIRECAQSDRPLRGYKGVKWYHQERMQPTDAVFFNMDAVPHGSASLGYRMTKVRRAIVITFRAKDIVSE